MVDLACVFAFMATHATAAEVVKNAYVPVMHFAPV